jgi:hypothetical protein
MGFCFTSYLLMRKKVSLNPGYSGILFEKNQKTPSSAIRERIKMFHSISHYVVAPRCDA